MTRTTEEDKEYHCLSYKLKRIYDLESKLNPEYTHKQLMIIVGFDEISDRFLAPVV